MELPYNLVISFLGISKRNEIRISKRCPSCSLQLYSSNQSILKEISPGCLLEGLMLKLKLQYFGHLMRRADSLEKTLVLGKIEGTRRRGWQRMSWMASRTQWTWVCVNSGSWWWTGRPGVLRLMGLQRVGHDWATELNWTKTRKTQISIDGWMDKENVVCEYIYIHTDI